MRNDRNMKTSVEDAADVLFKQIMKQNIRKAIGQRHFMNLGTMEYNLEPLIDAVGWDIAECYLDAEDFIEQNRKAIRNLINSMLPQDFYITSPRYFEDTILVWIGHKTAGFILDV